MVRGRRRHTEPVFLDRSGRRRRLLTIAGAALGAVLVAVLGLFAVGVMAGGPGGWPGLPGWPDSGVRAGADTPVTTTGPDPTTSEALPVTRRPPTAPGATGAPAPTTTAKPGQGDEHRRTPRPTKPR